MSNYYGEFPNFTDDELKCSCCGTFNDSEEFKENMRKVQALRDRVGFSLPLSSGYRCPAHPIEAKKSKPGYHSIGAIDIKVRRNKAYLVLEAAFDMGFTGIGVNQKGDPVYRFIHLDSRPIEEATVWSY